MQRFASTPLLLALLAALVALLVAWFAPLPRLVLSDEEKAAARMPADRTDVQAAQAQFEKAQSAYKSYVASHDVGGAIGGLQSAVGNWQSQSFAPAARPAVVAASQPVLDYMAALHAYAQAGETYFQTLSHYDDELMAWTRSLGAQSDALRPDTWPIVEYLKVYPPPVGESTDYKDVTASQVASDTASLQMHLAALQEGSGSADLAAALNQDVAAVREAGRSIEYHENLHAQYGSLLGQYDQKVQSVATGTSTDTLSSGRVALATGFDVLLGVITLVGLAALFLPRLKRGQETGA
jgi:hypothetical protein